MKKLLLPLLICVLCLTACTKSQEDVLHLGINAVIEEIDTENRQITVSGTDEDSFLGQACRLTCQDIDMLYCNYKSGTTRPITLEDLQVGDAVILGIAESEISRYLKDGKVLQAAQLQLGTQRLGDK